MSYSKIIQHGRQIAAITPNSKNAHNLVSFGTRHFKSSANPTKVGSTIHTSNSECDPGHGSPDSRHNPKFHEMLTTWSRFGTRHFKSSANPTKVDGQVFTLWLLKNDPTWPPHSRHYPKFQKCSQLWSLLASRWLQIKVQKPLKLGQPFTWSYSKIIQHGCQMAAITPQVTQNAHNLVGPFGNIALQLSVQIPPKSGSTVHTSDSEMIQHGCQMAAITPSHQNAHNLVNFGNKHFNLGANPTNIGSTIPTSNSKMFEHGHQNDHWTPKWPLVNKLSTGHQNAHWSPKWPLVTKMTEHKRTIYVW